VNLRPDGLSRQSRGTATFRAPPRPEPDPDDKEQTMPRLIDVDTLPRTPHAHEFVGADHGEVPFSIILVDAPPEAGPRLHRHPYPEVFVIQSGQATIQLGSEEIVVVAGQIAIAPADTAHGFTNSGTTTLRLVAIHGAATFDTEWLTGPDPAWASRSADG
jgi:quercetin dioxygenase-like cupin family protein